MNELQQRLQQVVFPENGASVFAVFDGASIPDLLPSLYQLEPDYVCLYLGELEPDMAEVAPYLIHLEPESQFAQWVLGNGWGKHWGVFAHSYSDLRTLRKHFRRFLTVWDSKGQPLLFRYYDPRVMRAFLPSCNSEELEKFFGPVESYLVEDEEPEILLRFKETSGNLKTEKVRLDEAGTRV